MEVLIKKVGEKPYITGIGDTLQELQKIVGGYIEPVTFPNGVIMICNEEGKFNGSKPNFKLNYDVIMGDVIFLESDGEEFKSISDKNTKKMLDFLENVKTFN
jgi:predicted RNA-binding protein